MKDRGRKVTIGFQPSWLSVAALAATSAAVLARTDLLDSPVGLMIAGIAGAITIGDSLRFNVPEAPALPEAPRPQPAPEPVVAPAPPPVPAPTAAPVVVVVPPPEASPASSPMVPILSVEPERNNRSDLYLLPDMVTQQENSARYGELLQGVSDGVAFLDEKGHIVVANPALEAMLRLRGGELLGRHWNEFWPDQKLGETALAVDLPGAGHRASARLLPVSSASGSSHMLVLTEIPDQAPAPPAASREWVIQKHLESEFQRFFDHIGVFTLRLDSECRVVAANSLWERELGYPLVELQSAPVGKLIHPAFRDEALGGLQRLRNSDTYHRQPLQLMGKGGDSRRVEAIFGMLGEGAGPRQYFALFDDQQNAVRFEAELSRSENRYRHLVESIADGVLLLNEDDMIQFANKAALGIFGVSSLVGRDLREFQAPDQTTYLRPYRDGLRDGSERRFEFEVVQPSGVRRHLTVLATPQFDPRFRHIGTLLMMRDETVRHAAELDLIKNMAFKAALEEIADSINGNLELRQLMSSACEALVKYCEASFACALFQEGLDGELTESVSAQTGPGSTPEDLRDFLMHHGRLEEVLRTRERQVMTRHRLAASFGQRASLPDWATSFVASPVVLRGKLLAVLYAFTTSTEGFSREGQMRLEQMSAQTASTLSGILLFGEVNARNERLEQALKELRALEEQKQRYYSFLLDTMGGPLGQIGEMALRIQGVDELEAELQAELTSILGMAAEMRHNLEEFIVAEAPPGARTTIAGPPSGPAESLFDLLREAVEKVRHNYPKRRYAIVPPPPDAQQALRLPPGTEIRESFATVLEGLVELGFRVGESPVVMEAGALGNEAHVSIETTNSDDDTTDFENRVTHARRLLSPLGGRLSLEWGRDGSLRLTVTARLIRAVGAGH